MPLRESEKTSWKNGSPLGKSTVDPRVMATTRGTKVSSSWTMRARVSGSGDDVGRVLDEDDDVGELGPGPRRAASRRAARRRRPDGASGATRER